MLATEKTKRAQAKIVGYWDDLKEIPKEGPFVVCSMRGIVHVRGQGGIGCPVTMSTPMYRYIEAHNIPRGYEGACRLNQLYEAGEFEWCRDKLYPKETL